MCCIGAPFALASGTTKPEPPSEIALALFGCEVARAVGGCKPPAVLGVDMVEVPLGGFRMVLGCGGPELCSSSTPSVIF